MQITRFLNYLWRVWFFILGLSATILLAPFTYLFCLHQRTFGIAYFFIKIWCYTLFYGMGLRYSFQSTTGKEIEKGKQYIFIANHTSIMDVMLMVIIHPDHPICFVGKAELAKIPIFGTVYKRVSVLVDRKSLKSRSEVYGKAAEFMNMGRNIIIFPEGGVPDDTSVILDHFKDGAFILATQHHIPLVVYSFKGLKKIFPFANDQGHPGRVQVVLNDILPPEIKKEELQKKAFNLIYETLVSNK